MAALNERLRRLEARAKSPPPEVGPELLLLVKAIDNDRREMRGEEPEPCTKAEERQALDAARESVSYLELQRGLAASPEAVAAIERMQEENFQEIAAMSARLEGA
jgi:hypothetical protein